MSTEYYTLEEAAQLLKLHPQTLRRWIRQGKLQAKRFGKQFRLRPQDLEQAAQPALTEELSPLDREPVPQDVALAAVERTWGSFSLDHKVLRWAAEDTELEYEFS